MLSNEEEKAVKEDIALCIELNNKDKVNRLYFVRTQSIKPFDFTDDGIGAKAYYRIVKPKDTSLDSHSKEPQDLVTVITDEVDVIQKQTNAGYSFVLVLNNREIGTIAHLEVEVFQTEKESSQQIEKVQERVSVKTDTKKNIAVFGRKDSKTIFSGGKAFQYHVVIEPIRSLLEGVKRKVMVFSPAALDFIGPGDCNQTISIMGGC